MAREKAGWVYFILVHHETRSFVKIGFTWTCPWVRAKDLSIGNPIQLDVGGLIDGYLRDESKYHRLYYRYYERGEWFRFEGPIITLLNELPKPDPVAFHRTTTPACLASRCPLCRERALAIRRAS